MRRRKLPNRKHPKVAGHSQTTIKKNRRRMGEREIYIYQKGDSIKTRLWRTSRRYRAITRSTGQGKRRPDTLNSRSSSLPSTSRRIFDRAIPPSLPIRNERRPRTDDSVQKDIKCDFTICNKKLCSYYFFISELEAVCFNSRFLYKNSYETRVKLV